MSAVKVNLQFRLGESWHRFRCVCHAVRGRVAGIGRVLGAFESDASRDDADKSVTLTLMITGSTQSPREEKVIWRGQSPVGLADRRPGPRGVRLHSFLPGSGMLGPRLREAMAAYEEEFRARYVKR